MVKTVFKDVLVFDGNQSIKYKYVVLENDLIEKIVNETECYDVPNNSIVVDAKGYTLLPGLVDSHVHTSEDGLRDALKFGVMTELEMQGSFNKKGRTFQLKGKKGIADVLSAGMALTAEGGHPDELIPKGDGIPEFVLKKMATMTEEERTAFIKAHDETEHHHGEVLKLDSPENAVKYVDKQIQGGSDYIKIMIEDGSLLAAPGLPILNDEILRAGIEEAHRQNKLVLAHITKANAAKKAVELGVDGLAHGFIDRPNWTPELIKLIKEKDVFVVPTLVLSGSITGNITKEFSEDPRIISKLSDDWIETLHASFNTAPFIDFQDALDNVRDLHEAGVTLLAGTDVSIPQPSLGGLAHGASVHHELQLLVKAGLSEKEALASATFSPAKIFSLDDRGVIAVGKKANVFLVEGNPLERISDTLNITGIWKDGIRQI